MDKLETETWEEYAFKNNLFKIRYADKDQHIINDVNINDVNIPDATILNNRHCDWGYYMNCVYNGKVGFLDFIMHEIYTLRDKYKTGMYLFPIQLVENMTKEREDDIERQQWLFKEEAFWEKQWLQSLTRVPYMNEEQKETLRREKEERDKQRYHELKSIISETHKESLEELLALFTHIQPALRNEIRQAESQERIKAYQKYLKNKEIKSKIVELEQQLNQLKDELVK